MIFGSNEKVVLNGLETVLSQVDEEQVNEAIKLIPSIWGAVVHSDRGSQYTSVL